VALRAEELDVIPQVVAERHGAAGQIELPAAVADQVAERQLAGQSGADVLGKEAIEREHRRSVPDPDASRCRIRTRRPSSDGMAAWSPK